VAFLHGREKLVCVWGLLMFRKVFSLVLLGAALALAGCSSSKPAKVTASKNRFGESLSGFEGKGSPYFNGKGQIPRGGGKLHVGKPYQVAGRWFHPKAQPGYDRKGAASWYGEAFHRRKTSNGEYFDMNMLTAAHPTLPLPSYARVTNLANGKTIVVRINDRGPFVGTRIIDMSKASAVALDFKNKGKANVRVQWIGNAPLNDQGSHLAMMNRKVSTGASIGTLIAAADGPARGGEEDVQVAAAKLQQEPRLQQASFETRAEKQTTRNQAQIIQIGAFRTLEGAENARRSLSAIGPVQVFEWQTEQGPLYKVQMGPFISEIGANNALTTVQEQGFGQAVLESTRIEQVAFQH
jgi:rare lipoprotein A